MRRILAILVCILILGLPLRGGRTFNGTSDLAASIWPRNSLTTTGVQSLAVSFVLNVVANPTAGNTAVIFQSALNTNDPTVELYLKEFLFNGTYSSCSTNQVWLINDVVEAAGLQEFARGSLAPALGTHRYLMTASSVAATSQVNYVDGVRQTMTQCDGTGLSFSGHSPIDSTNDVTISWMSNNGCGNTNCSGTKAQFLNGTLSDFKVWYATSSSAYGLSTLDNDAVMLASCSASAEPPVLGTPAAYWPMYRTDSSPLLMFPGQTPGTTIKTMTLTGTTASDQQSNCPYGAGR